MKKVQEKNINNPEHWDKVWGERKRVKPPRDYVDKVLSLVKPKWSILDVGSGDGYVWKKWSGPKKNIYAIDFSKEGMKKSGLRGRIVNLNWSLPFESNSYDLVTSFEVVEHLNEPVMMIKDMVRVAKKRVLLSCPHNDKSLTDGLHLWGEITERDFQLIARCVNKIKRTTFLKAPSHSRSNNSLIVSFDLV